jgi:hypothetical protein
MNAILVYKWLLQSTSTASQDVERDTVTWSEVQRAATPTRFVADNLSYRFAVRRSLIVKRLSFGAN